METISEPPISDSLIETDEQSAARRDPFYLAVGWIRWLLDTLLPRVQASPQLLTQTPVTLTAQVAAIVATAIPLPVLAAGLYQVTAYVRVTTPASIASAVQVILGWTEGAVALTFTGTLLNGNLVTDTESITKVLQIDRATSITYATNYVSAGTPMDYELIVSVIQIG